MEDRQDGCWSFKKNSLNEEISQRLIPQGLARIFQMPL